jgi:general secretion pathway protein G
MEHHIRSGRLTLHGEAVGGLEAGAQPTRALRTSGRGYTLIELIIVMAIISVLVAIAVPLYQKSLLRTKESLLKNNLFTLRTVIDEYTFDKQKAPQTLENLVEEGYLRAVPIDPITGSAQTWRVIMEDSLTAVNQIQPGIYDVRSGSDQRSLEGTLYSDW